MTPLGKVVWQCYSFDEKEVIECYTFARRTEFVTSAASSVARSLARWWRRYWS
jgi:hypothetical protein